MSNQNHISVEILKSNPKPNPKHYNIETITDISKAVNSDNIDQFLVDFEAMLRGYLLVQSASPNPILFDKFTWIDD